MLDDELIPGHHRTDNQDGSRIVRDSADSGVDDLGGDSHTL
jgi:hypothetical protein